MLGTNPDLMEAHQQKVFEMFVHLGPERSLAKLLAVCNANGITISEPTLKRWSSRFKWQELVKASEEEIARRLADAAMPLHVASMQKDLDAIEILKKDFRDRVHRQEIKVETLADYALLLKIEASITGDPTKRINHGGDGDTNIHTENHISLTLTDEQLKTYMLVDAANKHGLPPPPTTYEANE